MCVLPVLPMLVLQVVTGGHYDVDVVVEGPGREVLYREVKQQYGQFQFKPAIAGTYQVSVSTRSKLFCYQKLCVR